MILGGPQSKTGRIEAECGDVTRKEQERAHPRPAGKVAQPGRATADPVGRSPPTREEGRMQDLAWTLPGLEQLVLRVHCR